jgi:hypothetical protein
MRLDQNPMFRKIIVPWYDSEAACLVMVVFMFVVLLFAFAGVSVAREYFEYHGHIWVPVLLMVMSCAVIVSTIIRLIRRYAYKFSR